MADAYGNERGRPPGMARSLQDPDVPDSVKTDIQELFVQQRRLGTPDPIAAGHTIHISGDRSGNLKVFGNCNQTITQDGTNYWTFKVLRNGADETGISVSQLQQTIPAWEQFHLGTLRVGPGDTLSLELTSTGSPSPSLTVVDFALGIDWEDD